ncbi:MAG: dihydroorotase [Bacteroidales bacterium]
MSKRIYIEGGKVVNDGESYFADLILNDGKIEHVLENVCRSERKFRQEKGDIDEIINAQGMLVIPGVIDDQVHFRDPGLTQKADIYTESRAAVAGGTTSFMEMPNTNPPALTQELLEYKYKIAAKKSLANFSFYMGTSNDNIEEVKKTNPKNVCGIKVFMGSSTGNMLVDKKETLEQIFSQAPTLVAVHCEDENTVQANMKAAREKYGEDVPFSQHPIIRSAEACYMGSSLAIELAKKHNTRLHVLHLTTGKETELFESGNVEDKNITVEVCVHHLNFNDKDYEIHGSKLKYNPAVKTEKDREQLWDALLDDRIDYIATDHSPHTAEEKDNTYFKAPSGGPLVQHSLMLMLEYVKKGKWTYEKLVEKMCHAPAKAFKIDNRGYIKQGYQGDIVLIKPETPFKVDRENMLSKCKWSLFDGVTFNHSIYATFVNGNLVYKDGKFFEEKMGERLLFNR